VNSRLRNVSCIRERQTTEGEFREDRDRWSGEEESGRVEE